MLESSAQEVAMPKWMPWMRRHMLSWLVPLLASLPAQGAAAADAPAARGPDIEAQAKVLARANAAVVGVRVVAVDDARSIENLGREREGSGVVIGPDGLVVTIGYLIMEADHVELVLERDRVVP